LFVHVTAAVNLSLKISLTGINPVGLIYEIRL